MGLAIDLRPHGTQDPREVLDWGIDWSGLLEQGELITSCAWSVETAQAGWGVVVTPLLIEGAVAWARVEVAAGNQADARWAEPGALVPIVAEAVTGDAREFVRTLRLRILRGAVSPAQRVADA